MTSMMMTGAGLMSIELRQSCPQGFTRADLEFTLGDKDRLDDFSKWMTGQTMSVCDGQSYHHNRYHDDHCRNGKDLITRQLIGHTDDSPFNWHCGYTGTGYYEDTPCKDNPHGIVVYRSDLERYLAGLPVID